LTPKGHYATISMKVLSSKHFLNSIHVPFGAEVRRKTKAAGSTVPIFIRNLRTLPVCEQTVVVTTANAMTQFSKSIDSGYVISSKSKEVTNNGETIHRRLHSN